MDLSSVIQSISLCVKAQNQQEIQNGQSCLEKLAIEPEYALKLMMTVDRSDLDINIRQFAVTELKNSIKKFWKPKTGPCFSNSDKEAVKNNLLDAIIRSADNTKLSKMYCKIIYDVCAFDFPENWTNLVQQAVNKINSSESPNVIFGSLLTLQQVFDTLQFEMKQPTRLEEVIPIVFPTYQTLIAKLMEVYNAESAYILKPILKSFHMCINIQLPTSLHGYDTLSQWMNFFRLLLDSDMPQHLTTPTDDESEIIRRDKHPLWKNKKWAGKILTRFILKHANKFFQQDPKCVELSEWLMKEQLPSITLSFIKQVILSQGMFIGNATLHFGIKFLSKVVLFENLFSVFKPSIESVLYDVILPKLYLTQKDSDVWESDPTEFVRQEDEFMNPGLRNHKNLSMDLIKAICSNKWSHNTYLHQFIKYIISLITTGVNSRNNQPVNLAMKDGIFFSMGQLKELLLKDDLLKNQIESMLENYVIPEFHNSNPFIRSRICFVMERFGNIDFINNKNIILSVEGITSCMKDKDLPVKFKAALALKSIIKQKQAQEMIKGHLSEVLQIYLKLMEEIDSEELVSALESIVEEFQNDISPYAYDLCVHLSAAFYKLCQKDIEGNNDDDGECQFAASGCLETIGKILASPITPQALVKIEEIIFPILNSCFVDEQCDFMSDSLYLLQQLTFKSQQISSQSQLWFYYPVLIYIVIGKENADLSVTAHLNEEQRTLVESSVNGWGAENIHEILIILKNFIQKGGDAIFTMKDLFGTSFIDLLFTCVSEMYKKCCSNEFGDADEEADYMKQVLTLFYCLIENHVQDQKISGAILTCIIKQALFNLNQPKMKNEVLVTNLEVISLCFYYNSVETFQILQNICGNQIVYALFERWLALVKYFKSDFQKQRLLLAFTSILSCSSLTEEIKNILPVILKHCATLTTEIVKLREDEEFEDDDENEGPQANGKVHKEDDDDDLDIDDDFDPLEKYVYNYLYNSPLEDIDEILILEQSLLQIAQTNPQYYQFLSKNLTDQDKMALQNNITVSKKRYEEYLKEKQGQSSSS